MRLLCVLDRPELSTFVNPAAFEVSGLGVRLFSHGVSPGLVKRLREGLEAGLADARLARFVERLSALRDTLPRGERAERMRRAVEGFEIQLRLRFPDWFDPQA